LKKAFHISSADNVATLLADADTETIEVIGRRRRIDQAGASGTPRVFHHLQTSGYAVVERWLPYINFYESHCL
jgi:hypothetical protein